ncbi:DUF6069 family protein [Plantactinospora sonchi]|uniref:DUF6069 family protein n=1 Tax=Plantactinospora sonchi TaxID=1544735 RepID=A0ABU7S1N0_9ACTN
MTEISVSRTGAATGVRRTGVVVATVVAAEAVFFTLDGLAGVDLAVRTGDTVAAVGAGAVAAAAGVAALVGWGLLALLERITARARRIWTVVAVVVLVGSLLGPLGGVDPAARLGLVALHLVCAGVLIVGLPRAGRRGRR